MTAENRRKGESIAKAEESGRKPVQPTQGAMAVKAAKEQSILPDGKSQSHIPKIEGVVSNQNMEAAIKAVARNKGAPGVDGVTVNEIDKMLEKEWRKTKQEILEGKYRPKPVRKVEIPKPGGKGIRQLGIPTVMDRIIQQAIYQEISGTFEELFSDHSYGFRPDRNAQQAVLKAQEYIQDGYEWVVDIDLEKFFDKVNHDILMARVARKIHDKKILLLIRRYLQAGIMEDGIVRGTDEGTPQGGPLSPLLSNIMLDDFDKELEKRNHKFSRYADDCNIYVKSEKAGERVMESVVKLLTTKLKLKVNEKKSAVAQPWERKFLGFTFVKGRDKKLIAIHESRIKRLKDKIRGLTKKLRGGNVTENIRRLIMPITRGWANYFSIADTKNIFSNIDGWIRRKIRSILWRQWKTPSTRLRELESYGIKRKAAALLAYSRRGPWCLSRSDVMHRALSNNTLELMGYKPMIDIVCARS